MSSLARTLRIGLISSAITLLTLVGITASVTIRRLLTWTDRRPEL